MRDPPTATRAALEKAARLICVTYAASAAPLSALADAWRALTLAARHPDPALRRLALRTLLLAVAHLDRSRPPGVATDDVAHALVDTVAADVAAGNALLAALVLGRALDPLHRAGVVWIRPAAGRQVLRLARRVLQSQPATAADPRELVQTITALGAIVQTAPAGEPAETRFIDAALLAALRSGHPQLQAAAALVLADDFPRSRANRIRVRRFLPWIRRAAAGSQKDAMHPLLAEALSRFWSQWYPRPADAVLLAFPRLDILSGYSLRRRRLLDAARKDTAFPAFGDVSLTAANTTSPAVLLQNRMLLRKVMHHMRAGGRYRVDANDVPLETVPAVASDPLLKPVLGDAPLEHASPADADADGYPSDDDECIDRLAAGDLDLFEPGEGGVAMLSFGAVRSASEIVFDGTGLGRQRVLLHNKLAEPAAFKIQTHPAEWFHAVPAVGTVPPSSSLPIEIRVSSRVRGSAAQSSRIDGFLRLRNRYGFPLERLALCAYNGPFLQVLNPRLDFGCCPMGEIRSFAVVVRNIGLAPVNASFQRRTQNPAFRLLSVHATLRPGQDHTFFVVFEPLVEGRTTEHLVVAANLESHDVHLEAVGGDALGVDLVGGAQELDLGIVFRTSTAPRVDAPLPIANADAVPIPVEFLRHSAELQINSIVVPPGGTSRAAVEFVPRRDGPFDETVLVLAPNSKPRTIRVRAFVGSLLRSPIASAVVLPGARPGTPSFAVVPLHNHSATDAVVFRVVVQPPFSFTLRDDPSLATDPAATAAYWQTRSEQHLAPRAAGFLIVRFQPDAPGLFRAGIEFQVLQPYLMSTTPTTLVGLCLQQRAVVDAEGPSPQAIRTAIHDPPDLALPTTDLPSQPAVVAGPWRHVPLRAYPPEQTVADSLAGDTLAWQDSHVLFLHPTVTQTLHLVNQSHVGRSYHLVLPRPFETTTPLDGIILPRESKEIVVACRIPARPTAQSSYHRAQPVSGCIYAIDHDTHMIASARLYGLGRPPLRVAVRERSIALPDCFVGDEASRSVVVENLCPLPLYWRIEFGTIEATGAFRAADGPQQDAFSVRGNIGVLAPWSRRDIVVSLAPPSAGDYKTWARFSIRPPTEPESDWVSVTTLPCTCSVHHGQLSIDPTFLNFGDVMIGAATHRTITISNLLPMQAARMLCVAPAPFSVPETSFEVGGLQSSESYALHVSLNPRSVGLHVGHVTLHSTLRSLAIPVIARSGIYSLHSNMGPPASVPGRTPANEQSLQVGESDSESETGQQAPADAAQGPPRFTVDLEMVSANNTLAKRFSVTNDGTIDMRLHRVETSSKFLSIVYWNPDTMDQSGGTTGSGASQARSAFGSENPDEPEVDWDEVDYQAAMQAKDDLARGSRVRATGGDSIGLEMPHILRAGETLTFSLAFKSDTAGEFFPSLVFYCQPASEPAAKKPPADAAAPENFRFLCRVVVQPAPVFSRSVIDFGLVAVKDSSTRTFSIFNPGLMAIRWSASINSSAMSVALQRRQSKVPFTVKPMSGAVPAGESAQVVVHYRPDAPQIHAEASLMLNTPLGFFSLALKGVSASVVPRLDCLIIDFGQKRVGSQAVKRVILTNAGYLEAPFSVDLQSSVFSVAQDHGVLPASGSAALDFIFDPILGKDYSASCHFTFGDDPNSPVWAATPPLNVEVRGSGGYPALKVLTPLVEFGVSMLNFPNKMIIRLTNEGTADAIIEFFSPYSAVYVEPNEPVTVPPSVVREVTVVYRPTNVEDLDTTLYIRSADRVITQQHTVELRGRVGVPSFVFEPKSAWDSVNFGICQIGQPARRSVRLANRGSIALDYTIGFLRMTDSKVPLRLDNVALLEAFVPETLRVEPLRGNIDIGQVVDLTITFTPRSFKEVTECAIVLRTKFQNVYGRIRGVGGDFFMELDTPLRTIDFGLCRLNRTFHRTINIANTGNVEMPFVVRAEPDDGNWAKFLHLVSSSYAVHHHEAAESRQDPQQQQQDSDQPTRPEWLRRLNRLGFDVTLFEGVCPAQSQRRVDVRFTPMTEQRVVCKLGFFSGKGWEVIEFSGFGGTPMLKLYNNNLEPFDGKVHDLGLSPVYKKQHLSFLLANEGSFDAQFFVRPYMPPEFHVQPLASVIRPQQMCPIEVTYLATDENSAGLDVKISWDGPSLTFGVIAQGASGTVDVDFLTDKDKAVNGLDFDLVVPLSRAYKLFAIHNRGQIVSNLALSSDSKHFLMRDVTHRFNSYADVSMVSAQGLIHDHDEDADRAIKFEQSTLVSIDPAGFVVIEVCCRILNEAAHTAVITLATDLGETTFSASANGCWVQLDHIGDMDFGDVAHRHKYTRTITIVNPSPLPLLMSFYWLVAGRADGEKKNPVVMFDATEEVRSGRALWKTTRAMLGKDASVSGKHRWSQLRNMIVQDTLDPSDTGKVLAALVGGRGAVQERDTGSSSRELLQQIVQGGNEGMPIGERLVQLGVQMVSRVKTLSWNPTTTYVETDMSTRHQALRAFYTAVSSRPILPELPPTYRPFLAVSPMIAPLSPYGKIDLTVTLILPTERRELAQLTVPGRFKRAGSNQRRPSLERTGRAEDILETHVNDEIMFLDNDSDDGDGDDDDGDDMPKWVSEREEEFLATLVCEPDLIGLENYEIPLFASPKLALVQVDGSRTLNFGRLPVGMAQSLSRTFRNVGTMEVVFRFRNENVGLTVTPHEGTIQEGESVKVEFSFRPILETVQCSDIVFQSNCAQPIKLSVYGTGGYAQLALEREGRLDFGRCMLNADTVKQLHLHNEGNAFLRVLKVEMEETEVWRRGEDWPMGGMVIQPGETRSVNVVFHPTTEAPLPGTIVIHTSMRTQIVEVKGTAREANILLDRTEIRFLGCIVQNAYLDRMQFSNIGEVPYPLSFHCPELEESGEVKFVPKEMVVPPYGKLPVRITYTPKTSRDSERHQLEVRSPYSDHRVALVLESGVADIVTEPTALDFGLFEQGQQPCQSVVLRNRGTMQVAFRVIQSDDTVLKVDPVEGVLDGDSQVELAVRYNEPLSVGQFEQKITVRASAEGWKQVITVRGHCNRPELDTSSLPDEIAFGDCGIGEPVSRELVVRNSGGYMLRLGMEADAPLRIDKNQLQIPGGGAETVHVSWTPKGAYLLRSMVRLIGQEESREVICTGRSVHAKFVVQPDFVDFGRCAAGSTVVRRVAVRNVGQTPVVWSVPSTHRDFAALAPASGTLAPGDKSEIAIEYAPTKRGAESQFTLLVEARGKYKAVALRGVCR